MKRRLFRSMCLLSGIVVLLTATLIAVLSYNGFFVDMKEQVHAELKYVQAGLNSVGTEYLDKLHLEETRARVTLIGEDGDVLFDSATGDPLENHLDRPEVQQAFATGMGEDSRVSKTFSSKTYYYAVRLDNGSVLRVSNTMDSVVSMWVSIVPAMLAIALIVFLLSLVLSILQTKRIVKPINALNLEAPIENAVYEELTPLLSRIEKQNRLIYQQMDDIRSRQLDFEAITTNMREGMMMIDTSGQILFYNPSATRILDVEPVQNGSQGQSYLVFNRSEEFQSAVNEALHGKPSERLLEIDERKYQMLINPVRDGEIIRGAVILLMDVTEKEEREQLRREFSANVSHELKTPLNVISGYAELMESGFVPPDNMQNVAGTIYKESQRLITMVEDIIKLSRLDENTGDLPKEHTDLYELAQVAVDYLESAAQARNITLTLEGEPTTVYGVRQILSEMVFNLCDNAVKYNRDNGSVTIRVSTQRGRPTFTVEDTGIGIPENQRSRVFERFYRVDKSHSRNIGGTGLGLSIVKHGAVYHNAEVSLHSREGVGTTIQIIFKA